MFERILCNWLYKYLTENNLLYCKHFRFQKGHPPKPAILQSVEQINQSFEKNEFIYGVFVDLCKAFEQLTNKFYLKKLEYSGIARNNWRWFENYLKDWKQLIRFEHNSTKKATVTCGVPQGSILRPLLFLLYENILHHASKVLKSIMFANDTDLFFSHSDINVLFEEMNKELKNLSHWFNANKLLLNVKKTKYSFFFTNHQKKMLFRCRSKSEYKWVYSCEWIFNKTMRSLKTWKSNMETSYSYRRKRNCKIYGSWPV